MLPQLLSDLQELPGGEPALVLPHHHRIEQPPPAPAPPPTAQLPADAAPTPPPSTTRHPCTPQRSPRAQRSPTQPPPAATPATSPDPGTPPSRSAHRTRTAHPKPAPGPAPQRADGFAHDPRTSPQKISIIDLEERIHLLITGVPTTALHPQGAQWAARHGSPERLDTGRLDPITASRARALP
jgi:hypothetical protein